MHVISKKAWKDAVAADPALEGPISEWYKVASSASWQNLMDVAFDNLTWPTCAHLIWPTLVNSSLLGSG